MWRKSQTLPSTYVLKNWAHSYCGDVYLTKNSKFFAGQKQAAIFVIYYVEPVGSFSDSKLAWGRWMDATGVVFMQPGHVF